MTRRQSLILAALIVVAMLILGLMVAAWPATASVGPAVTPSTYGPPGPTGGPR